MIYVFSSVVLCRSIEQPLSRILNRILLLISNLNERTLLSYAWQFNLSLLRLAILRLRQARVSGVSLTVMSFFLSFDDCEDRLELLLDFW